MLVKLLRRVCLEAAMGTVEGRVTFVYVLLQRRWGRRLVATDMAGRMALLLVLSQLDWVLKLLTAYIARVCLRYPRRLLELERGQLLTFGLRRLSVYGAFGRSSDAREIIIYRLAPVPLW